MRTIDLALLGFGNVGKAFAQLLLEKRIDLRQNYGINPRIVGIATGSHGFCIDSQGINLEQLVSVLDQSEMLDLSQFNREPGIADSDSFIQAVPADVLVETTPVNPRSGLPALDYLRAGARRGLHLITANKGPVVFGFRELSELTQNQGKLFRFESAVMDGAPIFSLFRGSLAGVQLRGFYGILNSCTNLLLDRMRVGETLDQAIQYAASVGITETDPSNDVDGWDAAIKVAALSNVLLGQNLTPQDVKPTGIRGITPLMIRQAESEGKRWKLLCRAGWQEGKFVCSVAPEMVAPDSPLYSVDGTSSFISFELDVLPGLGILESDPSPSTTAFGLLSDLIDIAKYKAGNHRVFLGLGTNIGDREQNLQKARQAIANEMTILKSSSIYETKAWGYTDQEDFLNQVVEADTSLTPIQLLDFVKRTESELGRVDSFRWGPRKIDVDILLYDSISLETERLTIPHPSLHQRAFVLVPMVELEPDFLHPTLHKTMRNLLAEVDASQVNLWK